MLIPASDPVHVLLVEDNPADTSLVEELLSDLASPTFSVHRAFRLGEARHDLGEATFDIVLTDLGLPDSLGLDTVEALQGAAPHTPLVVFTGYDHDGLGMESIQMGAQDFLPKEGLNAQLLSRTLRYAIERHRLEEEQRLWAKAFEASEAMLITDGSGTVLGINSAFTAVTGYTSEEAVGINPRQLLRSHCQDETFFAQIWEQIRSEGHWSGEVWNRRKDGSVFPGHETITEVHGPDGGVSHYVAVLHDITERKQLEKKLEELATHDRLTGVLNRGRVGELLDDEIARAERYETPLSVILLDIDFFKWLNDSLGHTVGDAVLQEMTRRLEERLRHTDHLGRWGGEEFLVLLPQTPLDDALMVAEKLRAAVAEPAFEQAGRVTISLGVTAFRSGEEQNALVERADYALYRAKAAGRDRAASLEATPPSESEAQKAHP